MKPTKSVNLSHASGMAERKGDKVGGLKNSLLFSGVLDIMAAKLVWTCEVSHS